MTHALRWPVVLALSTLAAGVAVYGGLPGAIRAPVVLWFVLVCPGMALIRLVRLGSVAAELTLAVALSIALAVLVPSALLYADAWSPPLGLAILMALTTAATAADGARARAR